MLAASVAQRIIQAVYVNKIDVFNTLLVFVAVLLAVRSIQRLKFNRTLPPGPWGLPWMGYLPFMNGDLHTKYCAMAKKYGSVFSVRLGSQLTVVLSDPRVIRETFRREEFTGRPCVEFINILEGYGECTRAQIPIITLYLAAFSAYRAADGVKELLLRAILSAGPLGDFSLAIATVGDETSSPPVSRGRIPNVRHLERKNSLRSGVDRSLPRSRPFPPLRFRSVKDTGCCFSVDAEPPPVRSSQSIGADRRPVETRAKQVESSRDSTSSSLLLQASSTRRVPCGRSRGDSFTTS